MNHSRTVANTMPDPDTRPYPGKQSCAVKCPNLILSESKRAKRPCQLDAVARDVQGSAGRLTRDGAIDLQGTPTFQMKRLHRHISKGSQPRTPEYCLAMEQQFLRDRQKGSPLGCPSASPRLSRRECGAAFPWLNVAGAFHRVPRQAVPVAGSAAAVRASGETT